MKSRRKRDNTPSKSRRLRKWLTGAIIAAVTAVLVQTITGAFTSIGSRLWTLFTGEAPIQVAVASDFVSFTRSPELRYVIPRPIEQIPRTPIYGVDPEEKFERWAESLGGVDGGSTLVQFTVTGRSQTPVILTNLRVTVIDRRPPLAGTFVGKPNAGPLELRYFSVNLDTSPTTIESFGEGEDDPANFPYKVSATEPEVFLISAYTETCDCAWVAELFWTAGDKSGSTIINNNGKPFRTTSTQNAALYNFIGEGELRRIER